MIELGANDGLRGLDPAGTEANLAAILDALAKRGIPALLSGMLAAPNLVRSTAMRSRRCSRDSGSGPACCSNPFFLEGSPATRR